MVNINSLYENSNFRNVRRGLVVALAEAASESFGLSRKSTKPGLLW